MKKLIILGLLLAQAVCCKAMDAKKLYNLLIEYGVKHPEIVVRQGILETGHFKSKAFRLKNNLFGIRAKNGKYARFKSVEACILAYKKQIQYKYKGGNYYKFLSRIGYAEDPKYVYKLKRIKVWKRR